MSLADELTVDILLQQFDVRRAKAPPLLANSFTLLIGAKQHIDAKCFDSADDALTSAIVLLYQSIVGHLHALPPSHIMSPKAATLPTWTIVAGAVYVAAALATWGMRPVHAEIARELHKTIGAFLEKREIYAAANRGQLAESFGAQVEYLADALILIDAAQTAEELRAIEYARLTGNAAYAALLRMLRGNS